MKFNQLLFNRDSKFINQSDPEVKFIFDIVTQDYKLRTRATNKKFDSGSEDTVIHENRIEVRGDIPDVRYSMTLLQKEVRTAIRIYRYLTARLVLGDELSIEEATYLSGIAFCDSAILHRVVMNLMFFKGFIFTEDEIKEYTNTTKSKPYITKIDDVNTRVNLRSIVCGGMSESEIYDEYIRTWDDIKRSCQEYPEIVLLDGTVPDNQFTTISYQTTVKSGERKALNFK